MKKQRNNIARHSAPLLLVVILSSFCAATSADAPRTNDRSEKANAYDRYRSGENTRGNEILVRPWENRARRDLRSTEKSTLEAGQKLSAADRVKEALFWLVGGPLAGAYIGTAGGYAPTVPGLVAGAAIGGAYGLAGSIHALLTGVPMRSDGSSPAKRLKSNRVSVNPDNQGTANNAHIEVAGSFGGHYKGEVRNGKRHGFGEMRYKKAGVVSIYRGNFADDKENGTGPCRLKNGNWKACTFKDGTLVASAY